MRRNLKKLNDNYLLLIFLSSNNLKLLDKVIKICMKNNLSFIKVKSFV